MTKDKIIRCAYVIVFTLLLINYLFLPSPGKSLVWEKISPNLYCYYQFYNPSVGWTKDSMSWMRVEIMRCPDAVPLISVKTDNYNIFVGSIMFILFFLGLTVVWFTRKYVVCLVFYLGKGLKSIFKKI
jgi:hypothetical protein